MRVETVYIYIHIQQPLSLPYHMSPEGGSDVGDTGSIMFFSLNHDNAKIHMAVPCQFHGLALYILTNYYIIYNSGKKTTSQTDMFEYYGKFSMLLNKKNSRLKQTEVGKHPLWDSRGTCSANRWALRVLALSPVGVPITWRILAGLDSVWTRGAKMDCSKRMIVVVPPHLRPEIVLTHVLTIN